jgi:aldehyde dehydrogenase (NAD+)
VNPFLDLFDAQKALFATGVTRSYDWRIDQLDRMARMIGENERRFQQAIAHDFKTASLEYVMETAAALSQAALQKDNLKEWMEPVEAPVPRSLRASGHKAFVHRDPYGVTLIMGPFNGPLTLMIRPALAALAAGNTCILKVHEELSATSPLLRELVAEYFDAAAVTTTPGDIPSTTEILKLPFDFIFFTGSTKVGKIVARAAAEHLTPVVLELGGQNPALVDETADIALSAKKIVWAATAWGGQWCVSPGYAYVHESVAAQFVAEATKALVEMYGDDPKSNPDYSRIIDPQAVDRLSAMIDLDKVIAGGRSDRAQRYLEPTIVYPVSWDDRIMEDEIFGPVLPVLTYGSLDEAFERMAATPAPLAGYVYSRNQATIDRFVGQLSFGGGAVNQNNVQLIIESMPFGGVGASGMGHYYGKHGFDMLTHAKSILVSPPDVSIDHLFPPYTRDKLEALSEWRNY